VVTAIVKNSRILEHTGRTGENKIYVLCKALGFNIDYNSGGREKKKNIQDRTDESGINPARCTKKLNT